MASYRVYFLNAEGRIMSAVDLSCDSDDHAAAEARRLADGRPVELWERARLIGRFEPSNSQ